MQSLTSFGRLVTFGLAGIWSQSLGLFGQGPAVVPSSQVHVGPDCIRIDQYFVDEVWAKVGERTCLRCHHSQGDASESQFILAPFDPGELDWSVIASNRKAFESMAKAMESEQSRLLLKAIGQLDHGGGTVVEAESTSLRVLQGFVDRVHRHDWQARSAESDSTPGERPFFDSVRMLSPPRLLRRMTLSLAGRLPTEAELQSVALKGYDAVDSLLISVMNETAFYERLKEGFNDIFLTIGIEDNAETLLSYDQFENTRLWYQNHDFSHLPEAERERARWKLADVYREALLREPLELIVYIVKNGKPFTELVTADYIMVSPHTSRGYGIFESIKDQFKDPSDAFEYIPARLPALKSRDGKVQESPTGFYPHAGFLSMFHYLRRYPSTETNRNRLRARMFYQHFLGIDIMQLAPRSTDASAVAAKYEIPTMQAPDCVVCHKTIDPVASLFQGYDFEGHALPRKEGWYQDMFQAGFEGEAIPDEQRWRAPQWLAERTVKDPRFAPAMVEHVYYILFGRKVLSPPDDIDDPYFASRRRAYRAQRQLIQNAARQFIDSQYDLKQIFRTIIASDFYRADGLAAVTDDPERSAELDDVGLVRLLSPEQLERKWEAIFGKRWGRLEGEMKILYGGIDSIAITERNADPSGAMGAIQRMAANDIACYHVSRDFRLPIDQRRLFPAIEPSVEPGDDMSNQQIKGAIAHLHRRILGQDATPSDSEVLQTFELFCGILDDAKAQGSFTSNETYFCGGREDFRTEDPKYTIRAWRAVVTYLLRQHEFLYE